MIVKTHVSLNGVFIPNKNFGLNDILNHETTEITFSRTKSVNKILPSDFHLFSIRMS